MNSPTHIKISTKKTMVKRLCACAVVFVAVFAVTVDGDAARKDEKIFAGGLRNELSLIIL